MSDLFESKSKSNSRQPLADRMRPRSLEEFAGQEHIIGEGKLLRRAIEADQLSSLIFYGPPGTGKTTLARIIAQTTKSHFESLNAVLSGVKDIREAIQKADDLKKYHQKTTILFIDEVHRFNKSQQDALLPHVESGLVILIGATTENPYFEVNKALVSRSRVFELHSLDDSDLNKIIDQALGHEERGFGSLGVEINDEARQHLISTCNGDARSLLNALELAVLSTKKDGERLVIDLSIAEDSIQKRAVMYDKDGDAHYDIISAFIKSMRGSDPDAALYWMARMIYAGEDPRFIFRRIAIFASEDVGLADPSAIVTVMACHQAYEFVGMPEGRYFLSQACLYCSLAPKSNSTKAVFGALDDVANKKSGEVPIHLKDGNRDGEELGHGKGYLYPHNFPGAYVDQQYLPDELIDRKYYTSSPRGAEKLLNDYLSQLKDRAKS